jgi:DNA-binding NtrC family response regulator
VAPCIREAVVTILIVAEDGTETPFREAEMAGGHPPSPVAQEVRLLVRELRLLEVERQLYLWALDRAGSGRKAAELLGVPRATFAGRIKRMGLVPVKVEDTEE